RRHWGSPQVDVSLSVSALQRRRARAGLIWATVSGPNRLPRRETISRHPLALTFFFSICVGLKTIVSPQVLPYTWRTKFSTLIRDVATIETPDLVFSQVYLAST